jgi:hypothetical protein
MKRIRIVVVFTLVLSGFLAPRCGAAIYNSNGTAESVRFFHDNQAQNGDTITLPPGIFVWTTGVAISKAITIQGAGIGVTIVKDAVQSGRLIDWRLAAGRTSRLTGIEFQDGGRTSIGLAPTGILGVTGSNTNGSKFRWDHCKWNNLHGFSVFETVLGVIDHNTFVKTNNGFTIYIYDSNWNGQRWGDGSWAAPTNFGSSEFLFIEDNDFVNNGTGAFFWGPITDALGGARFVVRHNTIFNSNVGNHGTESGGRIRGCRAMEVYRNMFTGTNVTNAVGGSRSGGLLFHDNTISGYFVNPPPEFHLANFRNFYSFPPWGGADGTNQWDVNEPTVFFTGTATANSSGTTVTVSGANWTPNYWAGYTIRRTSNVCGANSITSAWIEANTSNTIAYTGNGGYVIPSLLFCAGDTLEIRKVDHALDQCGRAAGSLITGDFPGRPAGWNNQVTEPCYSWNNGRAGLGGGPGVRANVHYFNNRPMPGYREYVYPHPLVSAQPPPSAACSNLQQRLNQLQRRQQQLQQRHRQNRQLNRRIRRLQRQLQVQHCV